MKNLICGVIVTISAGAIIAGNIHWNQKLSAQAQQIVKKDDSIVVNQAVENNTEPIEEKTTQQVKKEENKQDLSTYTRNLPQELQKKIIDASQNGQTLNMVIYGSESSSSEKEAWPDLLKQHLTETYGKDLFNVEILSEVNKTTVDVIRTKSYKKVNELNPDIALFEPFMIRDNNEKVSMQNRTGYIQKIINSWEAENEGITVLLQPSNPIHNAIYYPKQVDEIKNFAKENSITYIDHWENWPALDNKKLKEYVTASNQPNKSGHKVWAEYLGNYFTGKQGQGDR